MMRSLRGWIFSTLSTKKWPTLRLPASFFGGYFGSVGMVISWVALVVLSAQAGDEQQTSWPRQRSALVASGPQHYVRHSRQSTCPGPRAYLCMYTLYDSMTYV